MKSPIESMLDDDLRELTGGQPFVPDVDAITERGRVLRRRRIAAISGGGAAVAAAAVAVALAVGGGQPEVAAHQPATAVGPPSATAADTPSGTPSHAPAAIKGGVPSVDVLTARLTAAVTAAEATGKVRVVATTAGGSDEVITVPSQGWEENISWNASGVKQRVTFTQMLPGTGKYKAFMENKTLTLDYQNHSYEIATDYGPKKDEVNQFYEVAQPESVQDSSWSKLVGKATVNGQATYVLDQTGSGGFRCTMYVSQATLLPVREVAHTFAGEQIFDYSYSSGAGATAAASMPAIPAGFTRGSAHAGTYASKAGGAGTSGQG
jgi:hypothetical protein